MLCHCRICCDFYANKTDRGYVIADKPLFPFINPIADLQATVTFDQSRQALALCTQFFLVSSATEFEQLRALLSTLLEQEPLSESLQLLYRRIAQESSERLLFMNTAEKWAQAQDTELRAVAIAPEQWRITLWSPKPRVV